MSTEKKLTAMQEFMNRLKNDFGFVVSNNVTETYLEKEKQQIESVSIAMINIALDNVGNKKVSMKTEFDNYFNLTFKNE